MEGWIRRRQRRIEKNGRGFVLRQDDLKGFEKEKIIMYYLLSINLE